VAVGTGRGDDDEVADNRVGERDSLDQHVTALAVPADEVAGLPRRVEAAEDPGLEALAEQRDLQVVAHPAVDGDERARPALDGHDAVDGARSRGDHAASGLDRSEEQTSEL